MIAVTRKNLTEVAPGRNFTPIFTGGEITPLVEHVTTYKDLLKDTGNLSSERNRFIHENTIRKKCPAKGNSFI